MEYRERSVVLLPSKERTNLRISGNKLDYSERVTQVYYIESSDEFQDLYIISDEVIGRYDWFLTDTRNKITDNGGVPIWELKQCSNVSNGWIFSMDNDGLGYNTGWSKKIISTTNKSIEMRFDSEPWTFPYPGLSKEFIKCFVREYNKGNKITKVMVQYEKVYLGGRCLNCVFVQNHDKVVTECCSKCGNSIYDHIYESKLYINSNEDCIVIKVGEIGKLGLTVNHLKYYLGRGLMLHYKDEFGYNGIEKMVGITHNEILTDVDYADIGSIKPIMYRISDLDKYITDLGVVPLHVIRDMGIGLVDYSENLGKYREMIINDRGIDAWIGVIPFYIIEKLLEWNFWIFGDEYFDMGLISDKLLIELD